MQRPIRCGCCCPPVRAGGRLDLSCHYFNGMVILGLRKGDEVKVQERNSKKYYIIMEVSNPAE